MDIIRSIHLPGATCIHESTAYALLPAIWRRRTKASPRRRSLTGRKVSSPCALFCDCAQHLPCTARPSTHVHMPDRLCSRGIAPEHQGSAAPFLSLLILRSTARRTCSLPRRNLSTAARSQPWLAPRKFGSAAGRRRNASETPLAIQASRVVCTRRLRGDLTRRPSCFCAP
jgi:hypothetical protein